MYFFQYHAENEAGRLVPDLFLFFKKALYEAKASGFQSLSIVLHLANIKTKYIKL